MPPHRRRRWRSFCCKPLATLLFPTTSGSRADPQPRSGPVRDPYAKPSSTVQAALAHSSAPTTPGCRRATCRSVPGMARHTFGSDNHAPVHPDVLAALAAVNEGHDAPYGADDVTAAAV